MAYVRTEYPEFSWSMGRFKLLTNCERKYYYNYYAGHNGWEHWSATKEQQEVYLLKKLNNKYALSGDIVHKMIKEYINSNGALELNELKNSAITEFNRNCILSKEHGSKWNTKIKGFQMLQEFYYEEGIEEEEQLFVIESMEKCLNSFRNTKTIEDILKNDVEIIENGQLPPTKVGGM